MKNTNYQQAFSEAATTYINEISESLAVKGKDQQDKPKIDPSEDVLTRAEVEKMLEDHLSKIEKLILNQEKQIDQMDINTPETEVVEKTEGFLTKIKEALKEFADTVKYLVGDMADDARLKVKNGINRRVLRVNSSIKSLGEKIDKKFAIEEKLARIDPRDAKKEIQIDGKEVEKNQNENFSMTNEFVRKTQKVVDAYIDWEKNPVGYYADIEFNTLKDFYQKNKQDIEVNEVTKPTIDVIETAIKRENNFEPETVEEEIDGEQITSDNHYEGTFNIDVESVEEIHRQSIEKKDISRTNSEAINNQNSQKNSSKAITNHFDFNQISASAFAKRAVDPAANWDNLSTKFGDQDLNQAWQLFMKDAWNIQAEIAPMINSELASTWEKDYYDFFYEGGKEAYDSSVKNGTQLNYSREAIQHFENLYDSQIAKDMQESLANEIIGKHSPAAEKISTEVISDNQPLPHEIQESNPDLQTSNQEKRVVASQPNKFEQRMAAAVEKNKMIEKNMAESLDKHAVNEGPTMK